MATGRLRASLPVALGSAGRLRFFFPECRLGRTAQAGPDVGSAGSPPLGCGSYFPVEAQLEQNPIKLLFPPILHVAVK